MSPLNILFITPYPPTLIHVRTYNLLKYLARRNHKITLLYLEPPAEKNIDLPDLSLAQTHAIPLSRQQTLFNGLQAILSRKPFQVAYTHTSKMATMIAKIQKEHPFDVAHVEHLRGAEAAKTITGIPIVFDAVDAISLLFERVKDSGPTWKSRLMAHLDLNRTRHFEARLLEKFNRVIITSPHDKDALTRLSTTPHADERITVVANGVDLDYFAPMDIHRKTASIVFSGKMSYHANIAAALDLATDVMPWVWQKIPAAELVIAGKDPSPELRALQKNKRITVTGTVPDLRPYLAEATIAVSPIRYGVGIQNKVMEAMAMATPVISTSQAISALKVEMGKDILIADSPVDTANAIINLLEDDAKRQAMGKAGRHYVETHHTWENAVITLESVYRAAIADYK